MPGAFQLEAFFDTASNTFSYLVFDARSKQAAIIDSVLNFDTKSGRTSTQKADAILHRIETLQLQVAWHLETHVHADHISAAAYLQEKVGGQIAIAESVKCTQEIFGKLFNFTDKFSRDGSQFNRLLNDGDYLALGNLQIRVLATPGHTPACLSYVIDDGNQLHVFVGDTLFMPDFGTARCDFPGGSAEQLYNSIQKIFALPANTQLYLCHDYPPETRAENYLSSVQSQRESNVHIREGTSQDQFVAMRSARDANLQMPALLLPAVQLNMRAGRLPEPENNGVSYLKTPINLL